MYLLNYSLNYQNVNLRNFHLSIREQTPNPLPDRKVLDDVVFGTLGLTEDERDIVGSFKSRCVNEWLRYIKPNH